VNELRVKIGHQESRARHANAEGDFTDGDRAMDVALSLRADLVIAEAKLATLNQAQTDVNELVRVEQHRAALERAQAELIRRRESAGRCLAAVPELLGRLKRMLSDAEQHEQAGREAAREVHQLRVALGEDLPRPVPPDQPMAVEIALERDPMLRTIKNDDRY
jgi:hypothetical protein